MGNRLMRAGLGLLLAGAGIHEAAAQRAVQTPSSEAGGAPTVTAPPPGFPVSNFVFGGQLDTHFQAEITKADGTAAKGSVYNDSNLELYANYATWLSLNADAKLERTRNTNIDDYYPDRNTFFRSEGLTLRQLFATVRPTEDLAVYGGKIHPDFGSAWALTPGNFYNFGTDYEQDERIGLGVDYRLPDMLGIISPRISFETFYLDTSFLSNSLFSRPGLDDPTADRLRRYTHAQLGPSNTESFSSYTLALHGGQPDRGLSWQLSLTREATDDPEGKTEYGESFGATYDPTGDGIPLGTRLGVRPYLEYTHFSNFAGIADLERHYLVGGLSFLYVRWELDLAGGLRKSVGASNDTDHQQSLSLNYAVTPGLTVGGGINHVEVAGQGSWSFGPSLNYQIGF